MVAGLAACSLAVGAQESGCGGPGLNSGTYTLPVSSIARTFRLYVPPSYKRDAPARLVVVFHGWGGDEGEFMDDPNVINEARRRGYVLVGPRGLGSGAPDYSRNSWTFPGSATGLDGDGVNPASAGDTATTCNPVTTPDYTFPSCKSGIARNTCSWTQCQDDDVAFTLALVRHLKARLCIDPTHIYAAGGSTGGMFTWELGQNPLSAPTFRAIAALIGLPHRGYLAGPGRKGGRRAILITGTSDPIVPPGAWDDAAYTTSSNDGERYYYTGATAIVKSWSVAAGCAAANKEVPFGRAGSPADCRSYCPVKGARWPAVLDCRANMGHDYAFAWSWKLILDFFDRS